jgi:DnaJ domain
LPILSVTIDPAEVLGVGPDATLQEIRDAYRAKARRYHPDAGGDEWAFRLLVQSYESLSTARVTRAAARESEAPPRHPAPGRAQGFSDHSTPPPQPGSAHDDRESVRPGVQEPAADPTRVVDVERLALRFQFDHIWLISEHGSENRLLSCSLNVTWPDPKLAIPPESIVGHETILQNLQTGIDQVAAQTAADSSRSAVVDGRFSGWLSYPNSERASDAFDWLTRMLHSLGLSVHQWSRDVIIPRQAQSSRRGS